MKLCVILDIIILIAGIKPLHIKDYPIITSERLELTREYNLEHYGINTHLLNNPKMIVIHYTAMGSLKNSLSYFRPAKIWDHRRYIKIFGKVNVGVHFVVGRRGEVFSLIPTNVIGRHVIGFNHTSIGIENVARNEKELTEAQLKANALLIAHIIKKHPSVEYLIGHYEYMDKSLPHFQMFAEKNPDYRPTIKIDPGKSFMTRLRKLLMEDYGIELKR